MRYFALLALALVALTACGASSPSNVVASRSSAAPERVASSPASASSSANTGTLNGSPVTCSTVADPGPPSVTFSQVISGLQGLLPDWGSIVAGDPSKYDMAVLFSSEEDMDNYQGNQLASDSEQFVQDEQNYSGLWNYQAIDRSYASALKSDIKTLAADCPP